MVKKYSKLISCFLVTKQNNKLLMKNHEAHPIGFGPLSEVNATNYNHRQTHSCTHNHDYGRGHKESSKNIFSHNKWENNVTISNTTIIIKGFERAIILLHRGTNLHIDNTLYSSKFRRNLLSFKDIRLNCYHIETNNEGNMKYLYIT
ncbi:hypothetical protein CR513_06371, partial [Mucuna pruriens]